MALCHDRERSVEMSPDTAGRSACATSHHERFAVGARDELVGFRVAGEVRARSQSELVAGAVADVGQWQSPALKCALEIGS